MLRCARLLWPVFLLGIVGCGRAETEEERLKRMVPNAVGTTKVGGKVIVDGAPQAGIWVTLHPKDEDSTPLRPTGQTNENGEFQIATYTGGDGAPEGEYNITVAWLRYSPRALDWVGPDKLKNQYIDPQTTPFHVTVAKQPIELPTFDLKIEGVEEKPAPKEQPVPKRDR